MSRPSSRRSRPRPARARRGHEPRVLRQRRDGLLAAQHRRADDLGDRHASEPLDDLLGLLRGPSRPARRRGCARRARRRRWPTSGRAGAGSGWSRDPSLRPPARGSQPGDHDVDEPRPQAGLGPPRRPERRPAAPPGRRRAEVARAPGPRAWRAQQRGHRAIPGDAAGDGASRERRSRSSSRSSRRPAAHLNAWSAAWRSAISRNSSPARGPAVRLACTAAQRPSVRARPSASIESSTTAATRSSFAGSAGTSAPTRDAPAWRAMSSIVASTPVWRRARGAPRIRSRCAGVDSHSADHEASFTLRLRPSHIQLRSRTAPMAGPRRHPRPDRRRRRRYRRQRRARPAGRPASAAHGAEVVLAAATRPRPRPQPPRSRPGRRRRTSRSAGSTSPTSTVSPRSPMPSPVGRTCWSTTPGLMAIDEARTAQGVEMQFGVEPPRALRAHRPAAPAAARDTRLARRAPCRAWATAAPAAQADPRLERRYDRWQAYFQSKLANLRFTAELQRRLAAAGASTIAVAAHPGASNTDLGTEGSGLANRGMRFAPFFTQSAEAGARPMLRALTDPAVRGGEFYGPRFVVLARRRGPRDTDARGAGQRRRPSAVGRRRSSCSGLEPAFAVLTAGQVADTHPAPSATKSRTRQRYADTRRTRTRCVSRPSAAARRSPRSRRRTRSPWPPTIWTGRDAARCRCRGS